MSYILLIIGFVLLIKGADVLVEGSSNIAKVLRIPSIIIGLTIVAFGTSAPELAVSIKSSLAGYSDIAIGNIAGSSIFNLLMVIGATAIMKAIVVEKQALKKDFPFLILITLVCLILSADTVISGDLVNRLTRGDGIILLCFFGIFMFYLINSALNARNISLAESAAALEGEMVLESDKVEIKDIIFVVIGLVGVVIGGNWVVDGSKTIALSLGMSESLVGLTIVAMGTSLPELVTSVVAARKGESEMAIGNVIGSNIFNLLLVLGVASSISPIAINANLITDMVYLLVISIISFIIMKKKDILKKKEGIFFILLYVVYAAYIIWRN